MQQAGVVLFMCYFRFVCNVDDKQLFLRRRHDDHRRSHIPRAIHLHRGQRKFQACRSQGGLASGLFVVQQSGNLW